MLKAQYLVGITTDPTDESWPGDVYAITYRGKSRYISTYANGKNHKQKIFQLLDQYGQSMDRKTWDWHHIVERQHFALTQPTGCSDYQYLNVLPCILLSGEEHTAINSLLHSKPAEIWTNSQSGNMYEIINKLREMYRTAYMGFPVMQKIADNVLEFEMRRSNMKNPNIAAGMVKGAASWHSSGRG